MILKTMAICLCLQSISYLFLYNCFHSKPCDSGFYHFKMHLPIWTFVIALQSNIMRLICPKYHCTTCEVLVFYVFKQQHAFPSSRLCFALSRVTPLAFYCWADTKAADKNNNRPFLPSLSPRPPPPLPAHQHDSYQHGGVCVCMRVCFFPKIPEKTFTRDEARDASS